MRIANFVVCDDIRREIGGKHTLIGVYDDLNVLVPPDKPLTWPLNIKLCFFCILINEKEAFGYDKYEFIASQEGQTLAYLSESIKLPAGANTEHINLAFILNTVSILKPTRIDFFIRFFVDGKMVEELVPNSLKVNIISLPPQDRKV